MMDAATSATSATSAASKISPLNAALELVEAIRRDKEAWRIAQGMTCEQSDAMARLIEAMDPLPKFLQIAADEWRRAHLSAGHDPDSENYPRRSVAHTEEQDRLYAAGALH